MQTLTMAPADQPNSFLAPVPLVHWTSSTLDTFQVLNHIKFFSAPATGLLEHIFLMLTLFGFFSSFRSHQTITYSKRLSLTILPNGAHIFSQIILCFFPCFIFHIPLITLLMCLFSLCYSLSPQNNAWQICLCVRYGDGGRVWKERVQ